MEDSWEWNVLKMCADKMGLIITSSVTYSKNAHFCSIVIDGLLIAATTGDHLFDTINATAKKAFRKIEDYLPQKMENPFAMTDTNCDLDKQYQHFFPLFERYILDFQKHVDHVAPPTQTRATLKSNTTALVPANWSWETYNPCNPQYYNFTKNYTTAKCVTVKEEPHEIKVVKRKMLHEKHNHIDQSNIGFKMLLGLGWAGGPLGPNQDGIAEPISVELRSRRSGLGSTFGNIHSNIFFQFLKEYADDGRQCEDLEFSDDFSHKEKKKLYGCFAFIYQYNNNGKTAERGKKNLTQNHCKRSEFTT